MADRASSTAHACPRNCTRAEQSATDAHHRCPSSTAISRSSLIPIEQPAQPELVGHPAEQITKGGTSLRAWARAGRSAISPRTVSSAALRSRVDERRVSLRLTAALLRLARWHFTCTRTDAPGCSAGESPASRARSVVCHRRPERDDHPHLVALDVTDDVPLNPLCRWRRAARPCSRSEKGRWAWRPSDGEPRHHLLGVVLADAVNAGGDRRRDRLLVESLRHRDEAHTSVAACSGCVAHRGDVVGSRAPRRSSLGRRSCARHSTITWRPCRHGRDG